MILHRTKRFRFLYMLCLLLTDVCVLSAAYLGAYHLRPVFLDFVHAVPKPTRFLDYQNVLPFVVVIEIFAMIFQDLYGEKGFGNLEDLWPALFKAGGLSVLILMATTFLEKSVEYSRIVMLLNGVLMVFAAGCVRSVWLILEYVLKSRGVFVRRLLIYAPTSQTRDITREYASHPGLGVKVVGYCGESHEQETLPYLGGQGDVLSAIGREMIDELVVGEMEEGNLELISTIVEVENMGVSVTLVPTVQKIWLGNAYLTHMANHPVLKLSSEEFKGWKRIVKDVEDILLSLCGIVLAAPLMLFCAICVKLDSRGPVFFRQKRMGKNGRFFEMYKFRSMRQDAETELESLASRNEKDGALFKIREDPRITRVGRILRRTSLDELPQLFNVFRGEMSLIGPRPLPLYEVTDDLMEWHRIRQKALPGITGLWQVKGRSDLDFRELEKWDIHYVRNWSLWMDFKILLFTLPAVVRGRGAY